ncbi:MULTISPECIES: hypothetical protein [Epilithonimonas]|uniref:Uncharacterized protein n=1 Tax=Epilithonimonas hungarica TaxID=454006 RepID=A0A1G7G515_9FLAO|nr:MULTISPECIES: hypothetical protein [Epilithonimonas]SDE83256.1 hypothetical protein SAMN05421825_0335 [Epilithonimonas hungarica]
MLQFLLILLGLISNPSSSNNNTSNCGNDGSTTPTVAQPNPGDTGGEEGHPVPPKIIGG